MKTSVVITGIGAVTALGQTAEETFDGLCAGCSAVAQIRGFDASGFASPLAAQMEPFDPTDLGVSRHDARTMGLESFGLLVASRAAFAHAGLEDGYIPRDGIGFFVGMGTVDYDVEDLVKAVHECRCGDGALDYEKFYGYAFSQIHPLFPLRMLNNIGHSQVSIELGILGDNSTYSPHGEAGAQAMREAAGSVRQHSSLAALVGGVGEKVSPQSLARHGKLGWLSPSGRVRPFGNGADGAVLGEAAATIVLEDAESAKARGKRPMAEFCGFAMRMARSERTEALSEAIAESMFAALSAAELNADEVSVILANADGRPANDAGEARAIQDVFRHHPIVTTTRGALGATLAAAAVVDTVMAVISLQRGLVPPCYSAEANDGEGIDLVGGDAREFEGDCVLINVQGLGGQCASFVLRAVKE